MIYSPESYACLPVKITETSGVFLSISSEIDDYSGAGKKLYWPITLILTVPRSLTNQLNLWFCFKIASKNCKGYKTTCILLYSAT